MKVFKKIVTLIVCLLTVVVCFSGCGGSTSGEVEGTKSNFAKEELQPISVAFTVAIRKNNAKPALASKKLNDDITYAAKTNGSKIAGIEIDGEPSVIISIPVTVQKGLSDSMKTQDANKLIQGVVTKLGETVPKAPEADIIKGISKAVRELTASDSPEGNRVLYILDGGLQTTGVFNMSEVNIIDGYTEDTIKSVAHELPDMSSINHVYWIGLGDFADEQEDISESNKTKLENFWRGVLEAAGTSVDFLYDNTVSEPTPEDWPSVSEVAFVDDVVTVDELNFDSGIRLDETVLAFKPNTAEFLDETSAFNAVSEMARVLKMNVNQNVVLIGSTATYGSPDNCKVLSRKRAEAVKQLLIEQGVRSDRISTIGIGQDKASFKVQDVSENGTFIEEQAKLNRAVFVFDSNSSAVERFI